MPPTHHREIAWRQVIVDGRQSDAATGQLGNFAGECGV
jgi:hypothetical protein